MKKFRIQILTPDRLIQLAFDVHPDGFDTSEFQPLTKRLSEVWLEHFKEVIFLVSVSLHYDNHIALWGEVATRSTDFSEEEGADIHELWSELVVLGAKKGLTAKTYRAFARSMAGEFIRVLAPAKPNFAAMPDVYLTKKPAPLNFESFLDARSLNPKMN